MSRLEPGVPFSAQGSGSGSGGPSGRRGSSGGGGPRPSHFLDSKNLPALEPHALDSVSGAVSPAQSGEKKNKSKPPIQTGILTVNTPCKWWCPFILVEKAMFQMGKMYL